MRGEKGWLLGREKANARRGYPKKKKKKKWQRYDIPFRHKGKILTRIRV